ncbi:MAG: ROK family protein [Thermoleophilia bacterium]|nr:ROK family protein [Thermoleophilia bacterium]
MHCERVIGVDLGGTKILAGVVARDGVVGRTVEIPTPGDTQESVLAAVDSAVDDLLEDGVVAIGYGVPFNIDRHTGVALNATNLPLRDVHFPDRARARYGLPAGVENDGNAAALAEWCLGAGRGADDLLMLTLGTGIGGGIVLDGRLYRGWAELGHTVVIAGGACCQGDCHGRGHLETVASGLAADRVAVGLYGRGADASLLVERAHGGDPRAVEALGEIGRLLGVAIGSLQNIFDPDVVIVGGGFGIAAGELILEPARAAARGEALTPADETLRLTRAELGDEAGLIGAALVGFEALDGVR